MAIQRIDRVEWNPSAPNVNIFYTTDLPITNNGIDNNGYRLHVVWEIDGWRYADGATITNTYRPNPLPDIAPAGASGILLQYQKYQWAYDEEEGWDWWWDYTLDNGAIGNTPLVAYPSGIVAPSQINNFAYVIEY